MNSTQAKFISKETRQDVKTWVIAQVVYVILDIDHPSSTSTDINEENDVALLSLEIYTFVCIYDWQVML